VNADGTVTAVDVQAVVNQARGSSLANNDLNSDGIVNIADIQITINAVLGRGCFPDVSGSRPDISAVASPAPNLAGWNNSTVTVIFSCSSGTAPLTCPPPIAVSTETPGQIVSGTVTDAASATATTSVSVKLDKTAPSLNISSPGNGNTVTAAAQTISGTFIETLSGIAGITCNGGAATIAANVFTCPVSLSAGSNSITVLATDVAGNIGTSTLNLTYAPLPTVTLTAPANLSYLSLSPTTVSGSVSDPAATVVINSIPAAVANGQFSAQVPLAEGPNIITATATSPLGAAGTASITVTLDTMPPHVTITSPADQFVTTDASISVAGNVNDIVVGTVNSQQAQVTINGVQSQVANRTFLATNVPLNTGSNTVKAMAVDRAGNQATTQINVVRQAPQPGQIQVVSGNNQSATIGSALTEPLVVSLTDASGNPAANKPVIFTVTQNNGILASGGAPGASVVATTNPQGQASATWTLGMRSGAGSDAVQAYSVGSSGTAVFTATTTQSTPAMIVIDTGNNQTGAIGQPLAKPLIAVVVDAGHNRLAGIPVTFAVQQGGGSFAGRSSVVTDTDSDGRAAATLTLGLQEGTANNLAAADFANDTGFAASFTASGLAAGDPAKTIISGLVLDNSNQPIPGATIHANLTDMQTASAVSVQTAPMVQTDQNGNFAIYNAPVGLVKLLVDGSTATAPGAFPSLEYDMVTVAGQNNTVGQTIYLLPIKTANQLCVTATTGGGTLTIPEAPGFSLTFGPGQVTFPGGSQSGCVSVTVVHPDKVPMTPGFGQQPRFIVTIQPSGALFNPPAPITLPNVDGLAAREVTEMYSFDHDIGSFVAIGTGTVNDDGTEIRSNGGVGVLKAGWHCGGNSSPTGTAAQCAICFFCAGSLANCQPQGNGTPCGNGGTCQFGKGCVGGGGCSAGYTLANGQCCQGATCKPPMCPAGQTFDPVTGTCINVGPCAPGYTLTKGQCCQGNSCTPPQCPTGQTFNASTGTCQTSMCGTCNSGNPCITDSCTNGQCVASDNGLCQGQCQSGSTSSCSVGMLGGMCDGNGTCNLCGNPGVVSCSCNSGPVGTCVSGMCQCGAPHLSVNTTYLRIAWSPLTNGPATKTFVITNSGTGQLIGTLSTSSSSFSLSQTAFSLPPGGTLSVDLQFQPQIVPDVLSDNIVISSNDPSGHPYVIALSGYVYYKSASSAYGTFYYRDCLRVRIPGGGSLPVDGDRVSDACQDDSNDFEIDPAWITVYITRVSLPGCPGGTRQVNTLAVPAFARAFAVIGANPFLTAEILATQSDQCGTFVQRYIHDQSGNATSKVSNHSWGAAIDINADTNVRGYFTVLCQYEGCPGVASAANTALWQFAFQPAGFFWGEFYSISIPSDPMHFELLEPDGQ
jgi:hypothetical protein